MPIPAFRRYITKMILAGALSGVIVVAPVGAQSSRPKMDEAAQQQAQSAHPFAALSQSARTMRDSIVALAKRQVGVKYRRGASSPERGFDCSGLAKYVMEHFDISLPRTSREQAKAGTALKRDVSALRPGDLLTFGKGKRISHIGIYIGDGKYVHAPAPGERVREGSLLTSKISGWWKGARRMVALSDTLVTSDSTAN